MPDISGWWRDAHILNEVRQYEIADQTGNLTKPFTATRTVMMTIYEAILFIRKGGILRLPYTGWLTEHALYYL